MNKKIKVKKASGEVEDFIPEKLRSSLIRSGADEETANEILDKILYDVSPFTDTKKIYSLAFKYLRRSSHPCGIRYSIKKSLFRLGPAGYLFERFISEILRKNGYETEVGSVINGRCLEHEVDVIAVNEKEILAIECKYHNSSGRATDAKVALYVDSRFRDLEETLKNRYPNRSYRGFLVTNTRCTTDAIKYAECSGFSILSWKYPVGRSLEKMIEDKQLYPVTILSGANREMLHKLIEKRLLFLKDIISVDTKVLQLELGITREKANSLKRQASELCMS